MIIVSNHMMTAKIIEIINSTIVEFDKIEKIEPLFECIVIQARLAAAGVESKIIAGYLIVNDTYVRHYWLESGSHSFDTFILRFDRTAASFVQYAVIEPVGKKRTDLETLHDCNLVAHFDSLYALYIAGRTDIY